MFKCVFGGGKMEQDGVLATGAIVVLAGNENSLISVN